MSVDMSQVAALAADLGGAGAKADVSSSAALTKVAAKLRDDIVAAAPVLTGATKASVKLSGGKGFRTVTAGSAAFYLEFGTSDTRPQPFVWNNVPAASERLAELLGDTNPLD